MVLFSFEASTEPQRHVVVDVVQILDPLLFPDKQWTIADQRSPSSRWQWGPKTRVPAGFYPIRGRGRAYFHPRGAVVGHIIQPDMFRGFAPVSVVPEPETRQNTFFTKH